MPNFKDFQLQGYLNTVHTAVISGTAVGKFYFIAHLSQIQTGSFGGTHSLTLAGAQSGHPCLRLIADICRGLTDTSQHLQQIEYISSAIVVDIPGLVYSQTAYKRKQVEYISTAVDLGKSDPLTHTLLGIHQIRLKRVDDAVLHFEKAMKRNPNNPLAMYHMALAHIQKEKQGKAAQIIDDILAFNYFVPIKTRAKTLLNKINSSDKTK